MPRKSRRDLERLALDYCRTCLDANDCDVYKEYRGAGRWLWRVTPIIHGAPDYSRGEALGSTIPEALDTLARLIRECP